MFVLHVESDKSELSLDACTYILKMGDRYSPLTHPVTMLVGRKYNCRVR